VVSSDEGDTDAVMDRVRKQLKKSGISEEEQQKILAQVEEAIAKATAAKKEWSEAGKAAAEAGKAAAHAAKEAATIVIHSEAASKAAEELAKGKEKIAKELRVQALNMDELRKQLPMLQGRVLQGLSSGGPGVPSYRIGIALSSTSSRDEEDDGDDEDEDEDEDEEDMVGLIVEDVMEDSPASAAGIQSGDTVVSVNGQVVKVFTDIQEAVQVAGKEEKPLVLTIRRDGKEKQIRVTPVKNDESDVSVMNLNLIPQEGVMVGPGFVFRGGQQMPNGEAGGAFTWSASGADESLKKEISELKAEVSELKAMIKKLLEK
jgi:membrane-associated protease RseP (regulator of RpoE activity)